RAAHANVVHDDLQAEVPIGCDQSFASQSAIEFRLEHVDLESVVVSELFLRFRRQLDGAALESFDSGSWRSRRVRLYDLQRAASKEPEQHRDHERSQSIHLFSPCNCLLRPISLRYWATVTLSNRMSMSAKVRVPAQFGENALALNALKGAAGGVPSGRV